MTKVLSVDGDVTLEVMCASGFTRMAVPVDLMPSVDFAPLFTLVTDPTTAVLEPDQTGTVAQPFGSLQQCIPVLGGLVSVWGAGAQFGDGPPVTTTVPDNTQLIFAGILDSANMVVGADCAIVIAATMIAAGLDVTVSNPGNVGSISVQVANNVCIGDISFNCPNVDVACIGVTGRELTFLSVQDTLLCRSASLTYCATVAITSTVLNQLDVKGGTYTGGMNCGTLYGLDAYFDCQTLFACQDAHVKGGTFNFGPSSTMNVTGGIANDFDGVKFRVYGPGALMTLAQETRFTNCDWTPATPMAFDNTSALMVFDATSWYSFLRSNCTITDANNILILGGFAIQQAVSDPVTLVAGDNVVTWSFVPNVGAGRYSIQASISATLAGSILVCWDAVSTGPLTIVAHVFLSGTVPVGDVTLTADFLMIA
jgi:hypothetical protein